MKIVICDEFDKALWAINKEKDKTTLVFTPESREINEEMIKLLKHAIVSIEPNLFGINEVLKTQKVNIQCITPPSIPDGPIMNSYFEAPESQNRGVDPRSPDYNIEFIYSVPQSHKPTKIKKR